MSEKWDKRFLDLAKHVANWSRDPSTQVGAVITRGKFVVSLGYNGFPAKCSDDETLYNDRKIKYARILHGEMNAILSAKQDLAGCTIYVHPFMPCSQCAAAIIQTGIIRVVTICPSNELKIRWGQSMKETTALFAEAGIIYDELLI